MALTNPPTRDRTQTHAKVAERRVAKSEFSAQIHTIFTIRSIPGATIPAELVEVADKAPTPGYEQFSLVFRVPVDTALEQRIYDLEHAVMGGLQLFLVPIGQGADALYWEAAFNRLLAETSAEG